MKKFLLLFVVVLLLGFQTQEIFGQTDQRGKPIRPYKENGYTKEEAKAFILGDGTLKQNYRRELLRIVNAGLAKVGEQIVFTENNLEYLVDSCITYKPVSLAKGYGNSRQFGDLIDFYFDKEPFQGEIGIFSYGKCQLMLYKTICMNLLQVSAESIAPIAGFQQYERVPIYGTYRDTIVVNVINNIVIEKDTIIINCPTVPGSPEPAVTMKNGQLKWWHIVLPLGAMIVGGVIYLDRHGKKVEPIDPIIPDPIDPGGPGGAPTTGGDAGGPGGSPTGGTGG